MLFISHLHLSACPFHCGSPTTQYSESGEKNSHGVKVTLLFSQRKTLHCTVVIEARDRTSKQECIWIKGKQWIWLVCRRPAWVLYINYILVEMGSEICWGSKQCTNFILAFTLIQEFHPSGLCPWKVQTPPCEGAQVLPLWCGQGVPSPAGIRTERQGRERGAAESSSEICWKTCAAWG